MVTPNPADLTIVREQRDRLTGDPGPATQHVIARCTWAPQPSSEQSDRSEVGAQVVTRRDVFPPDPAPDVRSTDRVRFAGETTAQWHVIGDVEQWTPPWGHGPEGSKFVVERTSG